MKFRLLIVSLLLVLFSYGQIINVENKRLGKSEEGWLGNVDFNFKYTQNTKSVWQVNNKIALQYKKLKNTHLFINDISIIRSNTNNLVNFGYAHYRFNRALVPGHKVKLEAFTQVQYNSVQKIKLRSLAGTGLRFKLIGNDTVNFNLGISAMYEYEEITTPEFNNAVRNSNYLSFNAKILKQWSLKTITYYQPSIGDFSDFRISNQTSVSHNLTKQISILGTLSYLYDSNPPQGVPSDIYSAGMKVRYKF